MSDENGAEGGDMLGAWTIGAGIGSAFSNWLTGRAQSKAAEESARESARQFDKEFEYIKEMDARNLAMWQEAQEAQAEHQAFEEAKSRAAFENTVDVQSPYRAASAAILGKTMGMDVRAHRPRYAVGEAPRDSPYKDYIAPRNRQRSA
jgi:hypothetical protein